MWQDSFLCVPGLVYVPWLISICAMTHSCMWHGDSFIYVPWLILICGVPDEFMWHDSFMNVAPLIPIRAMTHSCMHHDAFIYAPWRIHICGMTHSHMCHDAFICVPWRIHLCGRTHSYMWHDAFILASRAPWRLHVYTCVTWSICGACAAHFARVCDMTYLHVRHHSKDVLPARSLITAWRNYIRDMSIRVGDMTQRMRGAANVHGTWLSKWIWDMT